MSTQDNKEVTRKLADAHMRSDPTRVREILSPKLVWHVAGDAEPKDRDDYIAGIEMGAKAFSDISIEIVESVGEGDLVVNLTKVRMRHTGPFQGIEPTHRTLSFSSMWMYRIVDRQVVEAWMFDEDFTAKLRS